jgi:hypothetical protein
MSAQPDLKLWKEAAAEILKTAEWEIWHDLKR